MKATLADAIPNEDCLTIEDLATEFGLSVLRMRQVVDKALKDHVVPNVSKKDGRRILYTPQMVEALRKAKDGGRLGKFRKKSVSTALKNANLVVTVPIFDPEIAKLLKQRFQTEDAMAKYLKEQLEGSVKSILTKKRELEERYEKELANLFRGSDLTM